jgi:hypothetical protein
MPVVFVHGVSNRDTPEYRDNQLARDAFFREHVVRRLGLAANKVSVFNPYWGDNGVKFRWGNASLPESFDSMETFGTDLDPTDLTIGADIVAPLGPAATDIATIARTSLADAIDVVWAAALPAAKTADRSAALAESCRTAFDYAAAHPKPSWLANANNDNFVDLLLYHIRHYDEALTPPAAKDGIRWEHFGGGPLLEELKEGLSRILGLGPARISAMATTLGRKKVHLGTSMFLGDVLEYLAKRGDRDTFGPIIAVVLNALRAARGKRRADDPQLIVIGHSLGGVISYDILTYFDPTLEVDVFVTVGSQVALFEEMSLYKHAPLPANAPTERLARPTNIKRWLNVMDPNDAFSFRAEGVFEGVADFKYETGYGLTHAHAGYFHRPSFYRRLGERLVEVAP